METKSQSEPQTPQSAIAPPSRWWGVLRFTLVTIYLAAFFAGCLWLYTRNNGFPVEFHPDEPGKVEQVLNGIRNFRHPQLMLEATEIWRKWAAVPDDFQATAVAGRQVAAFFGAATAMMLVLTAYLCAGWWGLIVGSILLGLCPPLLTYSHYMKEDTSLLVGVAMVILASRIVWMTRQWWTRLGAWAMLAFGCALAASGKYVGAMTVAFPIVLFFIAPGFRWYRPVLRLLIFVPLLSVSLGVINHRTLNPDGLNFAAVARDPSQWRILFEPQFLSGLEGEAEHSATEHFGMTANRPNSYAMRTAIMLSWPVPFLAACTLPLVLVLTRRRSWGWEVLMLLFAAFCTLVLSYSIILFPRYALPVTVMVYLMAAISIGRLLAACGVRPIAQTTLGCLTTAALTALLLPTCLDYTQQFGNDSRHAVAQWLTKHLPANARVLADGYAALDSGVTGASPRIRVQSFFILGASPNLPYYIRSGETYYVICDLSYARYFEPSAFPVPEAAERSNFARDFYENLLKKQTPIWSAVPKRPMYGFTNPAIYVYKLTPEMLKDLKER